jgi:hypothetical protein
MKDAAAKMRRWTTSEEDAIAAIERKSRAAAIRRAVKAERERCVKCVWEADHERKNKRPNMFVGKVLAKINQAKRPSRRK